MKKSVNWLISWCIACSVFFLVSGYTKKENNTTCVLLAQVGVHPETTMGTYKKRIGYLWLNPNSLTAIVSEIEGTKHDAYYKNLTNVILAFVNPLNNTGTSIGFADSGDVASITEAKVKTLISLLKNKNPNIRIGIAIGGGNAAKGAMLTRFTTILNNTAYRTNFVNALVNITKNVGGHYLDIDLEYNCLDIANYNTFVQQNFAAAKSTGINQTLTFEYKYGDDGTITKVKKVTQTSFNSCDLLHVMSYDYDDTNYAPTRINDKNHSPVKIAKRDIDFFLTKVSADRLVLGIPFYGKSAYSTEPSSEYGDVVVNNIDANTGYYKGTKGDYYFNSKQMILDKLNYAAQKNICGVMFWSIRSDRMADYPNSILKYIVDNQQ